MPTGLYWSMSVETLVLHLQTLTTRLIQCSFSITLISSSEYWSRRSRSRQNWIFMSHSLTLKHRISEWKPFPHSSSCKHSTCEINVASSTSSRKTSLATAQWSGGYQRERETERDRETETETESSTKTSGHIAPLQLSSQLQLPSP